MRCRLTPLRVRLALVVTLAGLPCLALVHGVAQEPGGRKARADQPARSKHAWTYQEAMAQLAVHPRDPYLQYVAMQVAKRDNRTQAAGEEVARIVFDTPRNERAERTNNVDLFSIFTGALAVQESLQLDTMRGRQPNQPVDDKAEKRRKEVIDIATLKGPTIKSHPWEKMLAGKQPQVSALAKMVPEDSYLVEFRSLSKLLDLMDTGDLWTTHLFSQASRYARSQNVGERLRQQLVIETNRLLRPIYDTIVEDVAVTGSDLFVAEGSDVTLLFRLKQPDVFKARMDGFIAAAEKARPDAKRSEGEYLGVKYVQLSTPERDINVFSAYPEENLHVRSNSKVGLQRVLEAIKGKTPAGKAVARLGEATEYAYIRTLMPVGAKEEDGFVYLSDPFIRKLVGPQVKLTERRRMLCYNHLRMIGHAALMYRTEFGKVPKSLDELVKTKCCPGTFNEGELTCIDGGKYTLSADGSQGVCSHHGHAQQLVPCCETPLSWVNGLEADEYKSFLDEYNRYWRTFFDPIGIRVQVTPERYRMETIVLPLIDNSIYTGLAMALNGKPEPLDGLPVPKRNIFSVVGRINKEELLKSPAVDSEKELRRQLARDLGIPEKDAEDLDLVKLVSQGLGNQVGLHLYDAAPMFDLDVSRMLGMMFGTFNGSNRNLRTEDLWISFIVASLNAPVYVSLPVQDEKVVDTFLDKLDKALVVVSRQRESVNRWIRFEQDFYRAKLADGALMRGYGFSLGPVKWRFFWARIGGGLYIASKPFILEDLQAAHNARLKEKEDRKQDADTTAHALLRLRPKNWSQVLPDYRLSWAENNRQACLHNLGPLSSVGRAVLAEAEAREDGKPLTEAQLSKEVQRFTERFYAVQLYCPEGGKYVYSPTTRTCACSVHGTADSPRQPLAPNETRGPGKVMQDFTGLTTTLTFLEDGLHAIMVLERK
jgi:hypothetical protein